jgi:hypothetical protein
VQSKAILSLAPQQFKIRRDGALYRFVPQGDEQLQVGFGTDDPSSDCTADVQLCIVRTQDDRERWNTHLILAGPSGASTQWTDDSATSLNRPEEGEGWDASAEALLLHNAEVARRDAELKAQLERQGYVVHQTAAPSRCLSGPAPLASAGGLDADVACTPASPGFNGNY